MKRQELIEKFAEAIAQYEGFNKPNSVARRFNNPGNLRSWGDYPCVNTKGEPVAKGRGYVKFPTVADGQRALRQQISKNLDRDLTTYEFFAGKSGVYGGYAPAADQNTPLAYASFVAEKALGSKTLVNARLLTLIDDERSPS